jgi:hypothetical protein
MTTQTSQISAMEDGLLVKLLANGTLAGIAGPPQLNEPLDPLKEHCWIAEDIQADQVPNTTGNGWGTMLERANIMVFVIVERTGNDYKALRDRADVLTAAVESVVKTDPTLNGAAWDARVARVERISSVGDLDRFIVKVVTVEADAYLS